MAVSSKEVFDFAHERACHFLTLYDILHNSRQRDGRRDWLDKFKRFMSWPVSDPIVRIDGKEKNSILILRGELGIDRKLFAEAYTGEILRAAIVAAVSALDKYMHDIVVEKSWVLLSGPEKSIPKELAALKVPVLTAKKALDSIRSDRKSRPGSQIKMQIQDMLHREFTFQNVSAIERGAKILGVQNFWKKVAAQMPNNPSAGDVQTMLTKVSRRRNKIVHEADVVRKISAQMIRQNSVSRKEAEDMVYWVRDFVYAMDIQFLGEGE